MRVIGAALAMIGAVMGPLGWVLSVQSSPVLHIPYCTGLLFNLGECDKVVHNITGGYMTGMVGSIVGGLVLIVVGLSVMASDY